MSLTIFIIGLSLLIGAILVFGVFDYAQYRPFHPTVDLSIKKFSYLTLGLVGAAIIGSAMSVEAAYAMKDIAFSVTNRLWFYFGIVIFFAGGASILLFWAANRKHATDGMKIVRYTRVLSLVSLAVVLFGFSCSLEGMVGIISYPLPKNLLEIGKLHVTYYALLIISGAILALVIATRKFRKLGYRKDILENLFYVAFPAGIVGARIWYVIAEWGKEFAGQPIENIFKIWEGGLAIQGGVILGAIVGIWFMWKFRPRINLFMAVDLIVPGILLAQAIGRFGNFVNHEVFGAVVSREAWSFLPNWLLNQMYVPDHPESIYVPLFLVEAIANIIGYFVLTDFVGGFLKKKDIAVYGDVGCGYLLWYGVVRAIMEPMRNPNFIMGNEDVKSSQIMAYVFIGLGLVGFAILHILHHKFPQWFVNKEVSPEDAGKPVVEEVEVVNG